jgi:pyrroline-5-carboxylate reductase
VQSRRRGDALEVRYTTRDGRSPDKQIARSFVAQTLCGAAQMALRDSDAHFGELRNRVESPGGTTIAGSCALEENGFRKAVIAAAAAAAAKSRAFADRFSA